MSFPRSSMLSGSDAAEAQIVRAQVHEVERRRPPADGALDRVGLRRLVQNRGRHLVLPDVEHPGEESLALGRIGLSLKSAARFVEGVGTAPEACDLNLTGRSPCDPQGAKGIWQAGGV